MYCDGCGAGVLDTERFCHVCGKALARLDPRYESRLGRHVRRLGILWLAISAVRMLPSLALISIFGYGVHFLPPEVPGFVHGMMQTVGGLYLAGAVLGLITGWGLLEREPWARMLAIVLACFSLLEMPFGTALGIYTLSVLAPARSEEEYRRLAQES